MNHYERDNGKKLPHEASNDEITLKKKTKWKISKLSIKAEKRRYTYYLMVRTQLELIRVVWYVLSTEGLFTR